MMMMNHSMDLVAHAAIGLFAAISIGLRLHNIHFPAHVCWDEVHFGKYASYYINRTVFFDVHPPLGKMILAFAGVTSGYNGELSFNKPGDSMEDIEYVGMRQTSAFFGSLIVPLSSAIVWESTKSLTSTFICGVLVLCDSALIVISRFILLDSFLISFALLAIYFYTKHKNSEPFSLLWWVSLLGCGTFMACAVSVKFIGLFVVGFIGISVIGDLWEVVCDKAQMFEKILQNFLARVYTLIFVPAAVYCFIFVVHFIILNKSGPGDVFYSSAYQSSIIGNSLYHVKMPEFVAFGSEVSLRNDRPNGGYLHSHVHLYPEGGRLAYQQVSLYQHKDTNNNWIIERAEEEKKDKAGVDRPVYVRNGNLVHLRHISTNGYLYSHESPAPITKSHRQVSCVGSQDDVSDDNHVFRIKVLSGQQDDNRISPIFTTFQLIHVNGDCVIQSKDKPLPQWASGQREVSCNPNQKSIYSHWNIERLVDPRLPEVRLDWKGLRPGFINKLVESHLVMFSNNRNLKAKPEDNPSQPWMWPIAYKGQLFSAEPKVSMLGNRFTHWLVLLSLMPATVLFVVDSVIYQRKKAFQKDGKAFDEAGCYRTLSWLFVGWCCHYVPFWLMSRVLYPHHYLSAYVFSCMFTGVSLDHMMKRFLNLFSKPSSTALLYMAVTLLTALCAGSLYLLLPTVYGDEAFEETLPSQFRAIYSLLNNDIGSQLFRFFS